MPTANAKGVGHTVVSEIGGGEVAELLRADAAWRQHAPAVEVRQEGEAQGVDDLQLARGNGGGGGGYAWE